MSRVFFVLFFSPLWSSITRWYVDSCNWSRSKVDRASILEITFTLRSTQIDQDYSSQCNHERKESQWFFNLTEMFLQEKSEGCLAKKCEGHTHVILSDGIGLSFIGDLSERHAEETTLFLLRLGLRFFKSFDKTFLNDTVEPLPIGDRKQCALFVFSENSTWHGDAF